MAETYNISNISIDSEAFAATYWYAGTLELFDEEHNFTVSTDDEGYVLNITWTEGPPTDDPQLLELIENDIRNKA